MQITLNTLLQTLSQILTPTRRTGAIFALVLALFSGCTAQKPELWIYTSIYKDVVRELEPIFEKNLPEVKVQWFQGGSEIIAAKLEAERAAGKTQADLILTSDPFWYLELKKKDALLPYSSPAAASVPTEWKDPDQTFSTVRVPVMMLAHHSSFQQPPRQWTDLTQSAYAQKIAMGSPLESGTFFTSVALLSSVKGWSFFSSLRQNEILASGGNSSVVQRLVTQERPVGMVLLENILQAKAKSSPIEAIYPEDGVIPIPSPIAIMKSTRSPEIAKKAYDLFFSEEVQKKIVASGMYSPLSQLPPPAGAKPRRELQPKAIAVNMNVLHQLFSQRDEIKKTFSDRVLK